MIKLLVTLCLAALAALGGAGHDGAASVDAGGAPREESGVLREEFFVLEALPEDPGPDLERVLGRPHVEARVVGLAALRRRVDEQGRTLEWDLRFPGEDVRVLHVERIGQLGPSLVWREWQADRGRTITLESSAGGISILEWGGERPVRGELEPGATLPLALLEDLRAGVIRTGSFPVFDPLSRQLAELRVQVSELISARRLVQLRRPDGSSAGTYLFEGADLVAFQWQAGHLRARRIDATDYLQRLAAAAR